MAVVKFSQKDILMSKQLDPNFYTFVVTKADPVRASTSGKSINFDITMELAKGPFTGKEHVITFNTGMNSGSILNSRQYEPHTRLMDLDSALNSKPKASEPYDVDTDTFVGKKFDGKVAYDIVDGNPQMKITVFVPEGKGGEAAPF